MGIEKYKRFFKAELGIGNEESMKYNLLEKILYALALVGILGILVPTKNQKFRCVSYGVALSSSVFLEGYRLKRYYNKLKREEEYGASDRRYSSKKSD